MESILASGGGGEEFLIGPLSYASPDTQASYIQHRFESTVFAQISEAGPNSIRTVRFNIAAPAHFIDLSSLHFAFTVVNNDTQNDLQFLSPIPSICLNRATVRISSALLEDVNHFSKVESLLERFQPLDRRRNMSVMGFGHTSDATYQGDNLIAKPIPKNAASNVNWRNVIWRHLSLGILNSQKA